MKTVLSLLVIAAACSPLAAADKVDYERDVKPLLAERCGACHGPLKQEAGLRLDAGALIRKGSESGLVVVPGKASKSLLIEKVSTGDPDLRMPPEGEGTPLSERQVALLTAWIDLGAVSPKDEKVADLERHWAYKVPQRPQVPKIDDPRRSHPVDAFIAREHRRLDLIPAEQADRYTLLRRLYLDLIGLPPTRKQIEAFIEDDSPEAWQKVVDSLLESPQYGERWGRHWMDVWRYSDWDGYKNQLRGSQRHIWRWRDWIVNSLNADKGYDRMVVEMLAADEAAPGDPTRLPATGFLARNYHNSNRNIWLDATVEHTAKAFLGLTLNCARCHDHKYDPIAQPEYYRFRAIFEPHKVRVDRVPGQPDLMKDGLPHAYDAELEAPTYVYLRGNEKQPDKEHPVTPAVPAVLGGKFDVEAVELPRDAYYPALRDFVVNEQLAAARKRLANAEAAFKKASANGAETSLLEQKRAVAELNLQSLEARQAADVAKFSGDDGAHKKELAQAALGSERRLKVAQAEVAVAEKTAAFAAAQALDEKDAKKKKAALDKAQKELDAANKALKAAQDAQKKADGTYTPLGTDYPHTSSGRRLALARWIVSKENPLAARVAVNHIWMRHFGAPLVENVFDFGLRTPRPPHADLLDWLAVELVENQWSMKHLHRLIVTSQTWRLASSASKSVREHNDRIDPDNRFLWRMNVQRLDAEVVRDSVLAVSGQLDATMGGPEISYQQGETTRRRSIYLQHAYEKQARMLVTFDGASPNECYRRSESIIPQQALALTNSSLSLGKSRLLARTLWEEVAKADDPKPRFVQAAFLRILSRPASETEQTACLEFLDKQARTLSEPSKLTTFRGGDAPAVQPAGDPAQRALEDLVHVLLNHNDFVSVR